MYILKSILKKTNYNSNHHDRKEFVCILQQKHSKNDHKKFFEFLICIF